MVTRGPLDDMRELDRLVHDPSRLVILTALAACRQADFRFLLGLTGLTKGNLSAHLQKLERGGLVTITKGFRGKYPHTMLSLTTTGRAAIRTHWKRLEQLRKAATTWRPAEEMG